MKKILSVILCLLMVVTLIPVPAFSASATQTFTQYEEEEINDYIEDANFIE